ncbi:hypothetical protein [Shewanella algae]|uniref:hypothetical protein n=1 Tax=Shewanella algae TaxID=38313 RepID=UPI000BB661F2|nr:hypothetical protein [Shewanella algae]PBQ25549.1 hypothetical protein AYI97_19260 [Shewanella algae]
MSKVTVKDIESFGKVLSALSELCMSNPQVISQLLSQNGSQGSSNEQKNEPVSKEAEEFNVFHIIKKLSRKEAIDVLSKFNKTELKLIIKNNDLGATRFSATDRLAEFIFETTNKRTEDVFLNQENQEKRT